jgi:hypothetical protein
MCHLSSFKVGQIELDLAKFGNFVVGKLAILNVQLTVSKLSNTTLSLACAYITASKVAIVIIQCILFSEKIDEKSILTT